MTRLGYAMAVQHALYLRAKGRHWSWPVIADVMGEYHGIRRSANWWSRELKKAGAELRPRGGAFTA